MTYWSKYIKYKTKYLNLKNNNIRNHKLPIIHIAGASGSGKTYLGNKLEEKLGIKVIVKDLDDMREEYLLRKEKMNISFENFEKNYESDYQKFIDIFIKNNNKPIIFVGLNTYILGENFHFKNTEGKYPNAIFNLHANYKYYIDIDPIVLLKQRFDREFINYIDWFSDWIKSRKEILFDNLIMNESEARNDICAALTKIMNFSKIKDDIQKWDNFYHKQGYIFLSSDKIYDEVIKILSKKSY